MNQEAFQPVFHPRSIAVIGASGDQTKFGGRIYMMLKARKNQEKIYAVNPNVAEIDGQKAYARLRDIEGDVDFVVITVPAAFVVQAVRDCAEKKVRAVEILSSGFKEIGTEDGVAREREIVDIAGRNGLRVIGPNCFGVYSPESALTILPGPDYPQETGTLGVMAQSGGFTSLLVRKVVEHGILISKAVSYGNACDMNELDFLAYLRDDDRTRIIVAYIEGIREGGKFVNLVKETSLKKPVVIWKGGLSRQGSQAVASHTASLAGSKAVWDGVYSQTGALRAVGLDEIVDLIVGLYCVPDYNKTRMSVMGGGGAITVAAADALDREGLSILRFSEETQAAIRAWLPPHGNSVKNPVDIGAPRFIPGQFKPILEAIFQSGQVDAILIEHMIFAMSSQYDQELVNIITEVSARYGKTTIMTMPETSAASHEVRIEETRRIFRENYIKRSIPVFDSMQRAAAALGKIKRYNEFKAARLK